ncbi:MAG TPA: LysM peptidoglycan-binding domain-containing protein [Chryseolinea sp.]|nr:LysM peptidoglycan-binding domain-containing protein [Chryseolinea sp.]
MPQPPIYIVQQGDSLSRISKKLYGDFSQAEKIAQMNKISNPDLIYPGQQLIVPDVPVTIDTNAEVISSSSPSSSTSIKIWIGKAFPWIIVAGAAALLYYESRKQKTKNKKLKAGMSGFNDEV